MTIMLLSLAGFPPTAGFVGKFYVFKSAVQAGHIWLVIVGAINTAISAFYYLRVVVTMYMREPEEELPFASYPSTLVVGLVLAAIGVVAHRYSAIAHAHAGTEFGFLIVFSSDFFSRKNPFSRQLRGFRLTKPSFN